MHHDWHLQWLDRTFGPLNLYITVITFTICLYVGYALMATTWSPGRPRLIERSWSHEKEVTTNYILMLIYLFSTVLFMFVDSVSMYTLGSTSHASTNLVPNLTIDTLDTVARWFDADFFWMLLVTVSAAIVPWIVQIWLVHIFFGLERISAIATLRLALYWAALGFLSVTYLIPWTRSPILALRWPCLFNSVCLGSNFLWQLVWRARHNELAGPHVSKDKTTL